MTSTTLTPDAKAFLNNWGYEKDCDPLWDDAAEGDSHYFLPMALKCRLVRFQGKHHVHEHEYGLYNHGPNFDQAYHKPRQLVVAERAGLNPTYFNYDSVEATNLQHRLDTHPNYPWARPTLKARPY